MSYYGPPLSETFLGLEKSAPYAAQKKTGANVCFPPLRTFTTGELGLQSPYPRRRAGVRVSAHRLQRKNRRADQAERTQKPETGDPLRHTGSQRRNQSPEAIGDDVRRRRGWDCQCR